MNDQIETQQQLADEVIRLRQRVAELETVETRSRFNETKFAHALQIARVAYWEYDAARDLFFFNDQFYSILHTTAEREGGYTMPPARYAERFVHPHDRAVVGIEIQKALETTDPHYSRQLEHRIIYADGATGYVVVRFFIVKDEQGVTIKTYGANQDITDRKQMERALHLTQFCVDHASIGIMRTGRDARIVSVNDWFCQKLGYTAEEFYAMYTFDIDPGFPKERWLKHRQGLRTTGSNTFETAHRRKDGTTFPVEVTATFIEFEGSEFSCTFVRDISERRRMEEALRDTNHRLQALIQASPVAIIALDLNHCVVAWNPAAERIFGWRVEEVLGQFNPVIAPEQVAHFIESDTAALNRGGYSNFPTQRRRKDGTLVDVSLSTAPLRDTAGTLIGSVGMLEDITERKQLEIAEHEQRALAEALRETATALNSTLNLDEVLDRILDNVGRVVPHDAAHIMLIDPTHDEAYIVRAHSSDTHGMPDLPATWRLSTRRAAHLRRMIDTGLPVIIPDIHHDPDWIVIPNYQWLRAYVGAPIKIKGEVIGFIDLHRATAGFYTHAHAERLQTFADQAAVALENAQLYATIRIHAELLEQRVAERTRDLLEANARLTQIDQLKDEFVSRISHELRTPLANIKIYLELFEHGRPDKRAQYLTVLNQQTDRLRQLIEELLTLSHLDVDPAAAYLTPIDLNRLTRELIADHASIARERGLSIRHELDSDLPHALADHLLLAQALANLMMNALNYTPTPGTVTLITARRPAEFEGAAEMEWITWSVCDTGPGITDRDLPHIFERFYRGEAARNYKLPGAGLGLSIARTIIEKLCGRITVESQPGGTTFTVWLRPAPARVGPARPRHTRSI